MRRHAADFLPLIHGLLRDQNWPPSSLTHVFVSVGPGSFTGLRIGVTIARTLSWSIGARIVDAKTGDKPSTGQLIGRYFAYYVSVIPLFLGMVWVAFDPRKQGWHDKLAGTVVVRAKKRGPEAVRFGS